MHPGTARQPQEALLSFNARSAKAATAAASLAVGAAAVLATLPTFASAATAATPAVTTSPTATVSATTSATPTPAPTTTPPAAPVVPVALGAKADTSVGSAVAPNGDTHPYSVSVVPPGYTGSPLLPGDVLVGDIANSAGVKGRGTTILRFHAGASSVFSTAVTAPVAQVFNGNGSALWVAGYGATDTGTDGKVYVLHTQTGTTVPVTAPTSGSATPTPTVTTSATPVTTVSGDPFTGGVIADGHGAWGIEYNHSSTAPAYFWANADGTIVRDDHLAQPFDTTTSTANVQTTLATIAHGASPSIAGGTVVAPQGLVYDAVTDTLYVTDAVDSQILALKGAATATTAITPTVVVTGGPLHSPRGLAVDPLTGNLLVTNGAVDNKLVEITKAGAVVATRTLDAGAAGAIAGIATTSDAAGQTQVYYVNDNTNTLHTVSVSTAAVTISGAASLTPTYGTNVSINGRAPAGSTVAIFFHRANVPGYVQRRTLQADANGVFVTSFAPNDDYRYYAQVGTQQSAGVLVQATPSVVGTTTRLARKGHTIVLVGHGSPHTSVLLHFHKAGTAATDYSLLRSVHVDANGVWTKAVVVSVDYRVYGSRGVLHPYTPRYLLKGV